MRITVNIPDPIGLEAEEIAREEGLSVSALFARAVEQYLEDCVRRRAADEATLPSTIRQELKVNPFLRCHEQSVKHAAERFAGRELRSEPEVFATVRKWKDGFRN